MKLVTGFETRRARIEMVPMIDVIFLLLVFFIYVTMWATVHRGLRVDLPKGEGKIDPSKVVVITIAADNSLSIEGRAVTLPQAAAEAARMAGQSGGPVLVRGDRRANLGVAVELLSRLRSVDVSAVSFQVRKDE